jgi:hyperosmotically inducible periplasmic protein
MKKHLTVAALLAAGALATVQSYGAERTGEAKDAWITGKLEAVYALNRHLEGYAIDTDTQAGVVHLTGNVESDIDRDLAGELAKGIDGVVSVDNDLKVGSGSRKTAASSGNDRPFGVWVDDATTTASVKSKLLANPNTQGLKINVDTRGDVVTLSGQVSSNEEKQLAGELAKNSGDVKEVRNQLVVSRG